MPIGNHIQLFVGTELGNYLVNTNVPCDRVLMCFSPESPCLSPRVEIVAITATWRAKTNTAGLVVQTSLVTVPDRCIGDFKA